MVLTREGGLMVDTRAKPIVSAVIMGSQLLRSHEQLASTFVLNLSASPNGTTIERLTSDAGVDSNVRKRACRDKMQTLKSAHPCTATPVAFAPRCAKVRRSHWKRWQARGENMLTRRAALSTLLATTVLRPAHAQTFPSRTITIIVPYPAGGPT